MSEAEQKQHDWPYDRTFNAIGDAVTALPSGGISISVRKFAESFGPYKCAKHFALVEALKPTKAEADLRARLANNGHTTANNREGIPVGGPLHLAEMMLIQLEQARKAVANA